MDISGVWETVLLDDLQGRGKRMKDDSWIKKTTLYQWRCSLTGRCWDSRPCLFFPLTLAKGFNLLIPPICLCRQSEDCMSTCVGHHERRVYIYLCYQPQGMGKHTTVSSLLLLFPNTVPQWKKSAHEVVFYLGIAAAHTQVQWLAAFCPQYLPWLTYFPNGSFCGRCRLFQDFLWFSLLYMSEPVLEQMKCFICNWFEMLNMFDAIKDPGCCCSCDAWFYMVFSMLITLVNPADLWSACTSYLVMLRLRFRAVLKLSRNGCKFGGAVYWRDPPAAVGC